MLVFPTAVTQLLILRCPAARAQSDAFCQKRSCSRSAIKRSWSATSPLGDFRNAVAEIGEASLDSEIRNGIADFLAGAKVFASDCRVIPQ